MARKRHTVTAHVALAGPDKNKAPGKITGRWESCVDTEPSHTADGHFSVDVPGTKATGSLTTVAGANLIDTETFTIGDGVNAAKVFEFDSGGGVGAGNVAVAFTGADAVGTVRDAIVAAINAQEDLYITAANGAGAGDVDLTADNAGTYANVTITETVADAGFTVSGMSGGASATFEQVINDIVTAVNTAAGT